MEQNKLVSRNICIHEIHTNYERSFGEDMSGGYLMCTHPVTKFMVKTYAAFTNELIGFFIK